MKLLGVCIYTDNAPGLAAFYQAVLQETPVQEGDHYGFEHAQLAVYNPGDVHMVKDKSMSLMYHVADLLREYERLLREVPGIQITSPPEHRPWGAFSMWFTDPDGNTISLVEKNES